MLKKAYYLFCAVDIYMCIYMQQKNYEDKNQKCIFAVGKQNI